MNSATENLDAIYDTKQYIPQNDISHYSFFKIVFSNAQKRREDSEEDTSHLEYTEDVFFVQAGDV